MDHRLNSAPRHHQINTLLAYGTRQILENTEFVLLRSSMFGIASFSFVLLFIDDWQSKTTFIKVFNPLQQLFVKLFYHQSFYCMVAILYYS